MSRQYTASLPTPQNQITAKNPVQRTSAFAQGVGLVEDIGGEVLRNSALEELDKELTAIENARLAGGNRHKLSLQAKTKLNQAKAAAPLFSKEFDAAFSSKFGGGSGSSGGSGGGAGGVFSATPEEKGVEKATTATAELATMMNISFEQADELLAKKTYLTQQSEIEKADALVRKGKKERNADQVRLSSSSYVQNDILDLDASYGAIITSQGSLDATNKLMFTNSIAEKKRSAIADLDSKVKGKDGMLISGAEYDAQVLRINKRYDDYLAMISNNTLESKAKMITQENNAISAAMISEAMPLLSAVPDSVAPQVMEIYMNSKSSYGQAVQAANPWMTGFINSQEEFEQSTLSGMNTLVTPTAKITHKEAVAVGSTLANRTLAGQALLLLESATANPTMNTQLGEVAKKNPDVLMPYITNDRLRAKTNTEPTKYTNQLDEMLKGTAIAFKSMGIQGGSIPRNVSVTEKTMTVGTAPGQAPSVVIRGDGVTHDMALVGRNMYNAVKKNPKLALELGKKLGMAEEDITPESVTALYLNPNQAEAVSGKVTMEDPRKGQDGDPNADFAKANKAMARAFKIASESKEEEGVFTEDDLSFMIGTGAITEDDAQQYRNRGLVIDSETGDAPKEERTEGEEVSELDAEHLSKIETLRQQGYTKEQIVAVQQALGFSDNATQRRIIDLVDRVFANTGT